MTIPSECDYLVIGAGATGLAFCDSLLVGSNSEEQQQNNVNIVLLDPHNQPGGQWIDSYDFVQLHQPSAMYGVESMALQPADASTHHRATRDEILTYYQKVLQKWQTQITFVGKAKFDFSSLSSEATTAMEGESSSSVRTYRFQQILGDNGTNTPCEIRVRRKVVDARYLQPDLPVDTPPKFAFDASKINCIAVNALVVDVPATTTAAGDDDNKFVVIGGGKTGMDAVYYLLTQRKVSAANIVWVMPHDAWITARESIGNCLEFLHTALDLAQQQQAPDDLPKYVQASPNCLQQAFLKWEQQGKVYRLDANVLPTKFKDATLSKQELATLQTVTNVIRGRGRVTQITTSGDLHFENGSVLELPWKNSDNYKTTFVHCSAGAFNYTKQQPGSGPLPVFADHVLTIQDVYGTPGFCFVGSIMGKLESLSHLDNEQKNALCLVPPPPSGSLPPLGPSGGDIGTLGPSHGFVQRLTNVRRWLQVPELRDWLVGHRLFNLGHYPNAEAMQKMVDEAWSIATQSGLV